MRNDDLSVVKFKERLDVGDEVLMCIVFPEVSPGERISTSLEGKPYRIPMVVVESFEKSLGFDVGLRFWVQKRRDLRCGKRKDSGTCTVWATVPATVTCVTIAGQGRGLGRGRGIDLERLNLMSARRFPRYRPRRVELDDYPSNRHGVVELVGLLTIDPESTAYELKIRMERMTAVKNQDIHGMIEDNDGRYTEDFLLSFIQYMYRIDRIV
ncbi:hypothetical protein L6452_15517 [Arctium lappa]|uniref:Uncharacterized protein n=1 Tax=Arctium lappa TaxID=4217 RepID=A0ACB9CP33_ARCLA|nr:hypothetical protein L6452_15517 [Arctium lappa]